MRSERNDRGRTYEQEEDKSRGNEMSKRYNPVDDLDHDEGDYVDAAPITSAADLSETLHASEKVCFDCNLPEAGVYLTKPKRKIASRRKKSTRGPHGSCF